MHFGRTVLTINVGLVVGEQQVRIVVKQGIEERPEQIAVAVGELSRRNSIDHLAQRRVALVDLVGMISGRLR